MTGWEEGEEGDRWEKGAGKGASERRPAARDEPKADRSMCFRPLRERDGGTRCLCCFRMRDVAARDRTQARHGGGGRARSSRLLSLTILTKHIVALFFVFSAVSWGGIVLSIVLEPPCFAHREAGFRGNIDGEERWSLT